MEEPTQVHDVENVQLLKTAVCDGPCNAPGPHVPAGDGPGTVASRPVQAIPSLVEARDGRALRLQGLTAIPTRTP